MAEDVSGIPESVFFRGLSHREKVILDIVHNHWPVSALEIAEHLRENPSSREHKKQLSTKYVYYLKKLVEKRLIISKRVGNSLIVWPLKVEKYRAIDHILKGEH